MRVGHDRNQLDTLRQIADYGVLHRCIVIEERIGQVARQGDGGGEGRRHRLPMMVSRLAHGMALIHDVLVATDDDV